jgi:hypothetical protein
MATSSAYTALHVEAFQAAAAGVAPTTLGNAFAAELARRSFSNVPLKIVQAVAQPGSRSRISRARAEIDAHGCAQPPGVPGRRWRRNDA